MQLAICICFPFSFYRHHLSFSEFGSVYFKQPLNTSHSVTARIPTRPNIQLSWLGCFCLCGNHSVVNCPANTSTADDRSSVRDQSPFPLLQTPDSHPRMGDHSREPRSNHPVSHIVHYLWPESHLTQEWSRLLLYWWREDVIWDAAQVAKL